MMITTISLYFTACAPNQVQMSSRSGSLFDKKGAQIATGRRQPGAPGTRKEMYIRQKKFDIKPIDKVNETGSMFNPNDERNFLFTSSGPVSVGRFISFNVVSKRIDKKPGSAAGVDGAEKKSGGDEITNELLSALPDLSPSEPGEKSALKRIDMRIAHRYENGDALVTLQRTSIVDGEANEISISGRVPYDRLISGKQLTTDDLNEVKFNESNEGQLSERYSSAWEDEYTLRLSGFNEASSKIAMDLESKRQRLDEVKDRVKGQIESMSKERQKVADERERVLNKSAKDQEKVGELESTVREQEETIKSQQDVISDLSPADKAGDSKDGSDGA